MASYRSIESEPAVRNIDSFRGARDHASPVERLRDVRERARRFREEMLSGGQVVYYQSFDLVRVPYPTRYAFSNVYDTASVITPYIHILNRLFIVQFRSDDGIKTLLFSPSDVDGNRETPFFKRLSRGMGALTDVGEKVIAPKYNTVEECLEKVGLKPEHVDYISYDHLHTQALRKWLGTDGKSGYFPNAKLLVMRQEWESTLALLPPQMDWYCPDGLKGVDTEKVVLLDSDVRLGEGVALIQTPGHTEGDHSLVAHTPEEFLSLPRTAWARTPMPRRIPRSRPSGSTPAAPAWRLCSTATPSSGGSISTSPWCRSGKRPERPNAIRSFRT